MALSQGSRGPLVVLLKIRLDNLRSALQSQAPTLATWGPSHPESPVYDYITFLNVAAFQTIVNRSARAYHTPLIKVDGIFGPQTNWCLHVAENYYNVHY